MAMSQPQIVPKLPSIPISKLQDAVLASNGDSTISLISDNDSLCCFENGEAPHTINIINSSDVVVGSVTQFHGPVTIVQQLSALEAQRNEEKALEAKAKLSEAIKDEAHIWFCLPRRVFFYYIFIVAAFVGVIVTLVITYETTAAERDLDENASSYNLSGHTYFTVAEWGGRETIWVDPLTPPIEWIVISHTVTEQCQSFQSCSRLMRNIQNWHVNNGSPNIGYNFVIGGDSNVYEGRGWNARNFHLFNAGRSIGISFAGNYVYDEVSYDMEDVFEKLLELGVELNVLSPDYKLIAHNQTFLTISPGRNVYRVIKEHPNFYLHMTPRLAWEMIRP